MTGSMVKAVFDGRNRRFRTGLLWMKTVNNKERRFIIVSYRFLIGLDYNIYYSFLLRYDAYEAGNGGEKIRRT